MSEGYMIQIRKRNDRGHLNHGWLDTWHSFSFGSYYDPRFMGFRHLRVINEDFVAPNNGFPTHPHRDMEIITYILEGALQHRDSMGTGSVITPGEVQRMSAGTGVTHSEYNPSQTDPVHLLQIWILPERRGIAPSYEQTRFQRADLQGRLKLVASGDPNNGAVKIHQDTNLYASVLAPNQSLKHELKSERHAWLQVARGKISLNGTEMVAGDGAAVSEERVVEIAGKEDSEVLLFDLS
jgi:redox-sensitive bicupin YhaK (pirin superfamily)